MMRRSARGSSNTSKGKEEHGTTPHPRLPPVIPLPRPEFPPGPAPLRPVAFRSSSRSSPPLAIPPPSPSCSPSLTPPPPPCPLRFSFSLSPLRPQSTFGTRPPPPNSQIQTRRPRPPYPHRPPNRPFPPTLSFLLLLLLFLPLRPSSDSPGFPRGPRKAGGRATNRIRKSRPKQ